MVVEPELTHRDAVAGSERTTKSVAGEVAYTAEAGHLPWASPGAGRGLFEEEARSRPDLSAFRNGLDRPRPFRGPSGG